MSDDAWTVVCYYRYNTIGSIISIGVAVVFALVVGDYTELGYVSMDEITPYIMTRTTDMDEIMPAPMWSWCTDKHDFDQSYSTGAELY